MYVPLFSKRQKKRTHGKDELFQYDLLPKPFRVQVVHLWVEGLGPWREQSYDAPFHYPPNGWWEHIFELFTKELGVFHLGASGLDPFRQCQHHVLTVDTIGTLDLIELTFRWIDRVAREIPEHHRQRLGLTQADEVIAELNLRFREHGIGYEYIAGEIVRVDSNYLHAEAVEPAFTLLQSAGRLFAGPLDEFMKAHNHYRKGNDKDAISWALKALESALKAICTARRWPYDPDKDAAKQLIDIVYENKLVPPYLQDHFAGLRSALQSGVPTARNRTSGHGQGTIPTKVPEHVTRFVLNLTAANIVFFIECYKALK